MRPDLAISIFTRNACKRPITIFGDGTGGTSPTSRTSSGKPHRHAEGEAYNIGGGHRVSIKTLAETIIEITGSASEIRYADAVKGDAEHTFAGTKKAERDRVASAGIA